MRESRKTRYRSILSQKDIMNFDTQIAACDPERWIAINADTKEDAVIEALRKAHHAAPYPVTVYVADMNPRLRYENGSPMVVHAFTVERCS